MNMVMLETDGLIAYSLYKHMSVDQKINSNLYN